VRVFLVLFSVVFFIHSLCEGVCVCVWSLVGKLYTVWRIIDLNHNAAKTGELKNIRLAEVFVQHTSYKVKSQTDEWRALGSMKFLNFHRLSSFCSFFRVSTDCVNKHEHDDDDDDDRL